MNNHFCYTISNIRGDYTLLADLLENITNIAKYNRKTHKWEWKTKNTVLIILGDIIDRFCNKLEMDETSYRYQDNLTTKRAIATQEKIISCINELDEPNDHDNQVVFLMGDHELHQLIGDETYLPYAVKDINNEKEVQMHKEFVENFLRPLCAKHGIIAKWSRIFFSHSGLNYKWFEKHSIDSIKKANQIFQHWVKNNKYYNIKQILLNDQNSPVVSMDIFKFPMLWREKNKDDITELLSQENNADSQISQFVVANQSIQNIIANSWDLGIHKCECKEDVNKNRMKRPANVYASMSYENIDDIYYIHNQSADVFSPLFSNINHPQALCFILKLNKDKDIVFLDCTVLT